MMNTTVAVLTIIFASIIVTRAQRSKCGPQRFECRNGDCISGELLCDGRADCRDGSDETEVQCTKPEILCPAYAFRCAYGACVDGDAPCNGKKDCIDNSDETLPRCTGGSPLTGTTSCSNNEFKCNNGQCIPNSALCDGKVDCIDKSDETAEKCSSLTCIEFLFRCNYGACVDGDAKCNGIKDCADGSDEDPVACKVDPSTPSGGPTVWEPPSTPQRPGKTCTVPPQPVNGHWKLHRSLCPNGEDCDVPQSTQLGPGTYLVYTCNPGYKLTGSSNVFCDAQGMWLNIPVCIEIHCPPLNSASTKADCLRNNNYESCSSSVLPGTTAILSCRTSYREDTTLLLSRREVTCNQRGLWEPEPIRCVPDCGVISPNKVPLIVYGTSPNVTEFPWHATLYRLVPSNGTKEFICGATIIRDNLLISAAHCVYDSTARRLQDPTKYYVATGNVFRDYDSEYHDPRVVKKARVKNFYIPCDYIGLDGNYAADISVIELVTPFTFTPILVPACLDTNVFSDRVVLEPGKSGKVAGFGRTDRGPSSYLLQGLTVPYIPQGDCKVSGTQYDSEKYLTLDKFCAGYSNGSAVCDGDSGGGLVFQTSGLWYLRGIVSLSLGAREDGGRLICDPDTYTLYTRISNHITWLQDVMHKVTTYKSYPPC